MYIWHIIKALLWRHSSYVICVCMGRTVEIDCFAVCSHHLTIIVISGMEGAHAKYELNNLEDAHLVQLLEKGFQRLTFLELPCRSTGGLIKK